MALVASDAQETCRKGFFRRAQWPRRVLAVALCVSASLATLVAASPQSDVAAEYDLKAAYLYNFLKFVEWPSSVVARLDGQLRVCVLGAHPVADTLAGVNRKKIGDWELVVDSIQDTDQLDLCQVLFIPESVRPRVLEVREEAKGKGILTVTESEESDAPVGIINLWKLGDRIVFSVDLEAARNEGLRISARLLEVAVERGQSGVRFP